MRSIEKEYLKELIIHELVKEKRDIEINDSTSLEDLNLDSFALLSISSEIEDKYDIWLIQNSKQIEEMKSKMKTFGDFVNFLNDKLNDATRTK